MIRLLVVASLLFTNMSYAWTSLRLTDASFTIKTFSNNTSPFMPNGSKVAQEYDLNINLAVLKYFYFNSMIHSQTDQSQFRLVGWNWLFGTRITPWLDVGWEHFSRHTLDSVHRLRPFNEDSFFIKVRVYTDKPSNFLFDIP